MRKRVTRPLRMVSGVTRLRAMPKPMLRLVVLLAISAAPATAAPLGLNGYGLKDLCGDLEQAGYFAGAIDQSVWNRSARYCLPEDLQAWQARDAVCNFLVAEPAETMVYPAPWHIREALQSSFPCKSDPALAETQELPLVD